MSLSIQEIFIEHHMCARDPVRYQTKKFTQGVYTVVGFKVEGGGRARQVIRKLADDLLLPFFFLRLHPEYGSSQARDQIGAAAARVHHSHSNARSLTH